MATVPDLRALWVEQIELGTLPNVYFDTAALPVYFPDEMFPWPSAGRYLREAIERVGADKIMWGSDVPGLLGRGTYEQLLACVRDALREDERPAVLGGNASRVFG